MGLKDIFKKQPTKENATRGAVFNEYKHSAQEIYNSLQQARARGENVYVVYEIDHPLNYGTMRKRFYTLDNMTLNEIEDAIGERHIKPSAEHEKWLAKQKKDEEQRIEELQAKSIESGVYNFILPSQKKRWQEFVVNSARVDDAEFNYVVQIIKGLEENNGDMNCVKNVINSMKNDGHIRELEAVMDSVLAFSKYGPELYAEFKKIPAKDLPAQAKEGGYFKTDADKIIFIDKRNQREMQLANAVASELHEDWRKTRLNEDGSYEPRWKAIKDQNYVKGLNLDKLPSNIRMAENGYEIDIANSTYAQLSPDWQFENQEAGKVAAGLVIRREFGKENLTREDVGDEIHNEWLKRNTWAKGGELDVPFTKLPQNEQDKDLNQFKIACEINQRIDNKEKGIPEFYDFGIER